MVLSVISWSPGQSLARLASHFHSNQPVTKGKKLFPRLATNIWMACKSPDDLRHRTWCSVEGLHIQNAQLIAQVTKTDHSVIASNFACSDDRADTEQVLGSEALELDGLSSDSGHALTSWMTFEPMTALP